MRTKATLAALAFITLIAPIPLPAERPALGLGTRTGVAVAAQPLGYDSDFYTPKAQAVWAVDGLLDIPLFSALSLGEGLQLHGTTASSLAGGWAYRSHWGGALRLGTGYGFTVSQPSAPRRLEIGASAGGSFNIDLYTWTTLWRQVFTTSRPRRYKMRNGRTASENISEITLATMMRPMLKSTKNQQSSVAEMLAMQMMNTMWESHFWKI